MNFEFKQLGHQFGTVCNEREEELGNNNDIINTGADANEDCAKDNNMNYNWLLQLYFAQAASTRNIV